MDVTFEIVHTVTDYYDGPRLGVANYGGVPHVYRSLFLDDEDEWDVDRFELSPISPENLAVILEDWEIWRRFERAYKEGEVAWSGKEDEWGALPAELPRRRALAPLVEQVLTIDESQRIVARGEFRARENASPNLPPGVMRPLEVRWTRIE